MKYNTNIISLLVLFLLTACSQTSKMEEILILAGDNRAELEKVLNHYIQCPEDSLKLRAAEFLICNMVGHEENIVMLYNNNKKIALLNVLDFDNVSQYNQSIDSLRKIGQISIKNTIKKDINTISSEYLINQIELAFKAWEKPWSRNVDFDSFCNYILPYRGGSEPLSGMREKFFNKYIQSLDTIQGLNSPVEACRIINKILKDSIRYELKITYVNYSRTIEQIYESGYGSCGDMCLIGLYVMRSLGIPVVKEKTLWGRMSRGHEWCSVQDLDHKWHAFGAGEDQPDELMEKMSQRGYSILPKVYREGYAVQENNALRELLKTNHVPIAIYNSFFIKDVTQDYLPPISVSLPINSLDSFSYLCVYNLGKWEPIDFTKTENDKAIFTNLGTDFVNNQNNIIYAHCIYKDRKIVLCNPPFELFADGTRHEFISSPTSLSKEFLPMENSNIKYAYCYWNNELNNWQDLKPLYREELRAFYDNIPDNALLVRKAMHQSGDIDFRLCVLRDGKCIFYT